MKKAQCIHVIIILLCAILSNHVVSAVFFGHWRIKLRNKLCFCQVWWVVAMTTCQQSSHPGNRSWNQHSPTCFARSSLCRLNAGLLHVMSTLLKRFPQVSFLQIYRIIIFSSLLSWELVQVNYCKDYAWTTSKVRSGDDFSSSDFCWM